MSKAKTKPAKRPSAIETLDQDVPVSDPIWMRTSSGLSLRMDQPSPYEIDSMDIATSLARQCRYTGHVPFHYSIAQHSLNCLLLATHLHPGSYLLHLAILLHDAHEAYIGDINRGTRQLLFRWFGVNWKEIELHFNQAIEAKFGMPEHTLTSNIIRVIDDAVGALEDEAMQLGYGKQLDTDLLEPAERKKISFDFTPMGHHDVVTHFLSNLRICLGKARGVA